MPQELMSDEERSRQLPERPTDDESTWERLGLGEFVRDLLAKTDEVATGIEELRSEIGELASAINEPEGPAPEVNPVSDRTVEALLAYCDDKATTTTSDAARLLRSIARLGKVYCDVDAALADSADGMTAARTDHLIQLTRLATEVEVLSRAYAVLAGDRRMVGATTLTMAETVILHEQEVLQEIRDRLDLPDRYSPRARTTQMYEQADEATKAQLRSEARDGAAMAAEWED